MDIVAAAERGRFTGFCRFRDGTRFTIGEEIETLNYIKIGREAGEVHLEFSARMRNGKTLVIRQDDAVVDDSYGISQFPAGTLWLLERGRGQYVDAGPGAPVFELRYAIFFCETQEHILQVTCKAVAEDWNSLNKARLESQLKNIVDETLDAVVKGAPERRKRGRQS